MRDRVYSHENASWDYMQSQKFNQVVWEVQLQGSWFQSSDPIHCDDTFYIATDVMNRKLKIK